MDVASHIMPVTVSVKSINQPTDFTIMEQNYEYDLINAAKLLDKCVGKKIKIMDWNKYQDRKETVEAILLSNNKGPFTRLMMKYFLDIRVTRFCQVARELDSQTDPDVALPERFRKTPRPGGLLPNR